MKTRITSLALLLILAGLLEAQELRQGIALGYQDDISALMTLDVERVNPEIPISFGIMAGYGYQFDSGNAEAARQIFINDNTGGTISKYGSSVFLGADFRYALSADKNARFRLFAGPRGVFYQAHYTFIGGNESFAISSNQAGGAGGVQVIIAVTQTVDISLSAGISYFLPATLQGHGTYLYSPDGVDDNPRNDYTWDDADAAVNQPGFSVPLLFGVRWKL